MRKFIPMLPFCVSCFNPTGSASTETTELSTNATSEISTSTGLTSSSDSTLTAGSTQQQTSTGVDCPAGCRKYTAFGPQARVPVDSVYGWEVCYTDTFDKSDAAVATILELCDKGELMLACRSTGSAIYTVLAHAPREAVVADTGQSNVPTIANGTGWYFSESFSWGFAAEGDPIMRNSCDIAEANPGERLCFATGAGSIAPGYRCGGNLALNADPGWERVILHAD